MSADQLLAMKQEALNLLRGNRLDEAKDLFSKVCAQNAEDADVWFHLSCIHGMQGNIDLAEKCCRRAIELHPRHSEAHIILGNVLLSQGKLDDAVQHYQTSLDINPSNAGAQCSLGNALSMQGKHAEAAANYQAALRLNPNLFEAYYNLGNSRFALHEYEKALEDFQNAIRLNPNYAAAYNNLGNAQKELGNIAAAMENYRSAIRLQPNFIGAHNNLAIALREQGLLKEAYDTVRNALRIQPDYPEALFNLGNIQADMGETEQAVASFQRAIRISPNYAEAYNNLAIALMKLDRLEDARSMFESALKAKPNFAEAACNLGFVNYSLGFIDLAVEKCRESILIDPDFANSYIHLGNALIKQGNTAEAIKSYKRAIELKPDSAEAYSNLAAALRLQGLLDESERTVKEALRLDPELVHAYSTLDLVYFLQGRIKDSIEMSRKVLQIDPDNVVAHDNLLMGMPYDPDYTSDELFSVAREWGAQHELGQELLLPVDKNTNPGRKLRIGYISADFKIHPVGFFIEQVLKYHDKNQFEIFCYSNHAVTDDLTERLRRYSDHWSDVLYRSDEGLAHDINRDGIDILVDLSGHTSGNRLLSLAYKPAPIQATWIGYHATTGLPAMDYIIADRFLIPAPEEQYYTERVVRLPNAYLCFSPPDNQLEPGYPPASVSGKITFGCFNNPAKLMDQVIACWSRLLKVLPEAQLFLKYKAFADDGVRRRYQALFAHQGIDIGRIRFAGASPRHEYLAAYQEVDIALDPFPFNGCTTTLESLWMGVPVVTLRGDRYVGHMGETILSNLGLEEYVADNEDTYIAQAVHLATSSSTLEEFRKNLRTRLLQSPLCDGPGFTRSLEDVYKKLWAEWCQRQPV